MFGLNFTTELQGYLAGNILAFGHNFNLLLSFCQGVKDGFWYVSNFFPILPYSSITGETIHIKLIAERKTKTLIGAQMISEELVAGKIYRLAVAPARRFQLRS